MVGFHTDLFLLLTCLEIGIDLFHPKTQECIQHKGLHLVIILLVHHLIGSFMLYGWLLPNKNLLLLFIIVNALVLVEWKIHRRSKFTEYVNHQCDWKPDTPLRDMMYWLGLKDVKIGGLELHVLMAGALLLLGIYLYRSK
jgi:hypothetical protein